MMSCLLRRLAVITVFAFAAFPPQLAAAESTATVTIKGVHYTLPQMSLAGDIERIQLKPKSPLCHAFEYYYITIIGREMFINGTLVYQGRPGDRVAVSYDAGADYMKAVRVNGHPASPVPHRDLRGKHCESIDNGEALKIIRRTP